MHRFILSAIGRDRPGLVADLARLIYDCDANLEDSRMTILGSDFAVILACSAGAADAEDKLSMAAKRLERDHALTILLRRIEGGAPASAEPRRLYRVEAAGEDKAGIVAAICGVLAEAGANISELRSESQPGPGGSPHYRLAIQCEIGVDVDARALRESLERVADQLVVDVALMPA